MVLVIFAIYVLVGGALRLTPHYGVTGKGARIGGAVYLALGLGAIQLPLTLIGLSVIVVALLSLLATVVIVPVTVFVLVAIYGNAFAGRSTTTYVSLPPEGPDFEAERRRIMERASGRVAAYRAVGLTLVWLWIEGVIVIGPAIAVAGDHTADVIVAAFATGVLLAAPALGGLLALVRAAGLRGDIAVIRRAAPEDGAGPDGVRDRRRRPATLVLVLLLLGFGIAMTYVAGLACLSQPAPFDRLGIPVSPGSFLVASAALITGFGLAASTRRRWGWVLYLAVLAFFVLYVWSVARLWMTPEAGRLWSAIALCLALASLALLLRRSSRAWYGAGPAATVGEPGERDVQATGEVLPGTVVQGLAERASTQEAVPDKCTSSAPIGQWYVDPAGRHAYRYRNGEVWTDHVADEGRVAFDPLQPPSDQSPEQAFATFAGTAPVGGAPSSHDGGRRWARRLVAGVLLAVLVIVLAVETPRLGSESTDLADPGPLPARGSTRGDTPAARALSRPLSRFGLSLLLSEARRTRGNVVISPVSLACMLSMIGNGARGQTRAELDRALGVEAHNDFVISQGWADLITSAQSGKYATVTVCNSLWLRDGIPFEPAFLKTNQEYFAADCLPLDDDGGAACREINDWVCKRTSGKISELFRCGSLDPFTCLVAVNTVNLKVGWEVFKEKNTRLRPFTVDPVRPPVAVEMMHADIGTMDGQGVDFVDRGGLSAACLRTDGPVDVWVVVPRGDRTPEDAARTVARQGGVSWLYRASYEAADVTVDLPRCDFTYAPPDENVRADLAGMGARRLFTRKADLNGIAHTPGPFFVTRVAHTARLKIDEKGVEAQAASGGMGGCGAGPPPHIRADRPFLVVLAARSSRAPLFLAIVRDPSTGTAATAEPTAAPG